MVGKITVQYSFSKYLEPGCWTRPVATWLGCRLSWRTGLTLTFPDFAQTFSGSSSSSGQMWSSLGTTLSQAMLRVTRKSSAQNRGNLRLEISLLQHTEITDQVHDIVADPIGKYDIILSRHTLQVVILIDTTIITKLMIVIPQHLKTGDIERVIANFVKSGSTFLLTTNFPRTKV